MRVFQHRATQLLLLLGTVLHLQTCVVLVRGLHCIALSEGNFLLKDMQTACYTGEHVGIAVVVWLLIAVFGVGFPLLCWRLVSTRLDLDRHTVSTQFALKEVARRFNIDLWLVIRARDVDLLGVFTRYVSGTSRTYLLAIFPANLVLTLLLVPMHESATVGLFVLGLLFVAFLVAVMYRWPFKRGRYNVMSVVLCCVFVGLCCAGILLGPFTQPVIAQLEFVDPSILAAYIKLYTPISDLLLYAMVVVLVLLPLMFSVWVYRRSDKWKNRW
jgi:amino acid transporter